LFNKELGKTTVKIKLKGLKIKKPIESLKKKSYKKKLSFQNKSGFFKIR